MKILIGCEQSGVVRRAFRERGHDAWSCDILPSEDGSPYHCQSDVNLILRWGWDMMIAFPPCTHLCVSGARWFKGKKVEQAASIDFFMKLMSAPIEKICIENPVGIMSSNFRKPDQYVQPWEFGHDASKKTGLWLKNLPLLKPTYSVERPAWVDCPCCEDMLCVRHKVHVSDCDCPPLEYWIADGGDDPYRKHYGNQTPSGQNKLGPSATRAAERSRTYEGIAQAMADQWGEI